MRVFRCVSCVFETSLDSSYPLKDHETAASAVRNLHGTEVAGRPLRIDLADSDPFLEGKTTTKGEFIGLERERHAKDVLTGLPPGVLVPPGSTPLDVISKSLANIRPQQMIEILGQMKVRIYEASCFKTYLT